MERRKFINWGLVGLTGLAAILTGQGCNSKTPVYEGKIDAGVGRFCNIPNTNLIGILERDFDSSKLIGKTYRIYGKEKIDVTSRQNTGFVEIKKIIAEDGTQIYKKDKRLMDAEFPSQKLFDQHTYPSPKNFTYENEDSWKKLNINKINTKKIKLIGNFSSDYQWIYVQDEKDKKINKIKVNEISDWIKYQLQSNFLKNKSEELLEIYATVKKTFDIKQRTKTRELFSVNVRYILPKTKTN